MHIHISAHFPISDFFVLCVSVRLRSKSGVYVNESKSYHHRTRGTQPHDALSFFVYQRRLWTLIVPVRWSFCQPFFLCSYKLSGLPFPALAMNLRPLTSVHPSCVHRYHTFYNSVAATMIGYFCASNSSLPWTIYSRQSGDTWVS